MIEINSLIKLDKLQEDEYPGITYERIAVSRCRVSGDC